MKITYDKSSDSAYIWVTDTINPGEINFTYPCDPIALKTAQINLDFSDDLVLRGIEVLGASKHLPAELLEQAEIIG